MRRIVVGFGTRPEAIKLGPVVAELRHRGCEPELLCTAQHTTLLRGTPAETDLVGAYSLGLESDGDVERWLLRAAPLLYDRLDRETDLVVVQGDTMSAYAIALAASDLGIPVAHVEAGLRSHDPLEPDPEERFRVAIAKLATIHCCPTVIAMENLAAEGVDQGKYLTGNPVVSALERYATLIPVAEPADQVLVTMHRHEWKARGAKHVQATINALLETAERWPHVRFLWPMHPGVVQFAALKPWMLPRNALVSPPLAYTETITQLRRSIGVATDSGGLQEEAATLGVPCAVLRNVTDRPESIDVGLAALFPPDPAGMSDGLDWLLHRAAPRIPSSCFGTPDAARAIAQVLTTAPLTNDP